MSERSPDPEEQRIGDERTQVDAFVEHARVEIALLLDGVSEEQARERMVASETTLLGLVKHAAFVERVWAHVAITGRTRAELGLPEAAEDSWLLEPTDTVASVLADYRLAATQARELAAAYSLDDLVHHNRRSPLTLRWVLLHLVRELSRHAGHGDILREQILTADTGPTPDRGR